jgi:GntR family transcriptional regulator
MLFRVDFKSGRPVYLQLVDQVRYAAASGTLRHGDPLPSIRPLAEELRINRNTVAKAYAELESLGVIETIAGKGCFFKENGNPLSKATRDRLLLAKVDEAVVTAHQMQIGSEDFLGLIKERIQFFERKQAAAQPDIKEKEEIWTPTNLSSTSPTSTDATENWTPLTD